MVKISIIIPVYNDGKYIQKSIESVLNQSLKDIEIICVNDGSNDDSLQILNKLSNENNCIKVFNQENQGPAIARNKGIQESNGEYIGFLDADDFFIDNNALKRVYNVAKINNANMVSGNIKLVDSNGNFSPFKDLDYYKKDDVINPEEYGIPWAFYKSIYKREFLVRNSIYFPDLIRGEDPVFLAEILSKIDEIYTVPVDIYAYFYIDGFVKINSQRRIYDHLMHYKMVFDHLNDLKFNKVVHEFRHEMMGFIDLMGPERAEFVIKFIRDIFSEDLDILNVCEDYFYLRYKDDEDLKKLLKFDKDPSNPRISVIMPLNEIDEKFNHTVKSLINQTFDDFEVICFNDINSYLNDLARKDSRIKLFNDIGSINDALKIANGKYVYFFHPKANLQGIAFEELYKNAISNDSDMTLFMLAKYNKNGYIDFNSPIYNLHEYFDDITYHVFTFNYKDIKEYILSNIFITWNKFYKKEYLEKYDDLIIDKINQDEILFNVKTMLRADFISFAADYYYVYRGEDFKCLNTDYFDCNILSVIDDAESFLKDEGYFDELELEFNKFKIGQIISYLDASNSDECYNQSKSILLGFNQEVIGSLPYNLVNKYYSVITSSSLNEYKLFNNGIEDLVSTNKELLAINQYLLKENDKLNKKISKLTKKKNTY